MEDQRLNRYSGNTASIAGCCHSSRHRASSPGSARRILKRSAWPGRRPLTAVLRSAGLEAPRPPGLLGGGPRAQVGPHLLLDLDQGRDLLGGQLVDRGLMGLGAVLGVEHASGLEL